MKIKDPADPTKELLVYRFDEADGVAAPVVNDVVVIHGFIENYYKDSKNTIEVTFSDKDDATTNAKILSNVRGTSALTVSAEHATVTGVPATATNGTEVSFTVTPEDDYILDSVKLGNTELTATEGTYSFTVAGDATITVSAHKNGEVAAVTEILAYTTNSTVNMDGTNQASALGLSNRFSVVGNKNAAQNNIGLNKAGEVRLYGAASGNGNSLDVTVTGATIKTISIVWTASTGGKIYVGENEAELNGDVYTIEAASFTLKNVNKATTQVKFTSISITYLPTAA
jgi:hypothetical protein